MSTLEELVPAELLAALQDKLGLEKCDQVSSDEQARLEAILAPYDIPAGWLRGLARALVMHALYELAGDVPASIQKDYEAAEKDLEAIRKDEYNRLLKPGETPNSGPNGAAVVERELTHTRADQEGM